MVALTKILTAMYTKFSSRIIAVKHEQAMAVAAGALSRFYKSKAKIMGEEIAFR